MPERSEWRTNCKDIRRCCCDIHDRCEHESSCEEPHPPDGPLSADRPSNAPSGAASRAILEEPLCGKHRSEGRHAHRLHGWHPGALSYSYSPILGGDDIPVLSYAPETVLAEKFETIIRRGELNGCARDFYDVVLLARLYEGSLDWEALADAIRATVRRRGTEQALLSWRETLDAVRSSLYINETIWAPYAKANAYAANITIDDAMDACIYIAEGSGL